MRRQVARGLSSLLLFAPAAFALAPPAQAQERPTDTIIVMDGSGSMWGRIDGRPKLEIARETAAQALESLPADQVVGLMAYGHRVRGDCGDIELVVPPAPGSAAAIRRAIETMRFQGKTPLSEAVRRAAEVLRSTEAPANVVLVTDGIETCDADPCALAAELEASGVAFTAHVIGFGLSREEGAQVSCIAENTGGRYYDARDAASLRDALASAVSAEPATPAPAPAPEPEPEPAPEPETEASRRFPGAPLMPQAALSPTGRAFGEPMAAPAEISFPADGVADQCRAACDGDAACGSWRYEPPGSLFVEEARCFLYPPGTEFDIGYFPAEEGWASGMKEGVVGLVRPYVAIGAENVDVALDVAGPVAPGEEFTVLWSGPANGGDWVDVAPLDETEPFNDFSRFDVNETIEPGDAPEGAGVLVAPDAPGVYALRYVLGRSADQRVVHSVRLTVGGPSDQPAVAPSTAGERRGDAGPAATTAVAATFRAETGDFEPSIVWSAVPAPGQDLPAEAFAMQEGVVGPLTEMFLPGVYDVTGDAGDDVFAARVTITPEGPNDFAIPRSDRLSPSGEDTTDGYLCPGPEVCRVDDPTGLSFVLPAGWRSDAPFVAETAGGAKAGAPTVTFQGPGGSPVLILNPLRWLESSGVCTDSRVGPLCVAGATDGPALAAVGVILPSLAYRAP